MEGGGFAAAPAPAQRLDGLAEGRWSRGAGSLINYAFRVKHGKAIMWGFYSRVNQLCSAVAVFVFPWQLAAVAVVIIPSTRIIRIWHHRWRSTLRAPFKNYTPGLSSCGMGKFHNYVINQPGFQHVQRDCYDHCRNYSSNMIQKFAKTVAYDAVKKSVAGEVKDFVLKNRSSA